MRRIDISNEVKLKNGKANPFGWSQSEIHYKDKRIGWVENGYPSDFEDGYEFEAKKINDKTTQYLIYKVIKDGDIEILSVKDKGR